MKAAIFGGSFDPPHIGHEEIIKKALEKLDIDVLFVIPTYLNPFKKKFFAPPHLRYKWVKKLLLPYKKAKIIDFELRQKRPVPTIETIRYLQKKYNLDKIYLIIGADNLASLKDWKAYDELKKMVEFVIVTRNNTNIPKELKKLEVNAKISSTKLREHLKKHYLPPSVADEIMHYYNKEKNE
jgi:nicotinate-nucleotide adenylyltransferase